MKKPPPIIEPREPVDHPVVVADNVEPQPIHAGVGTEEPVRSQVDRLAPQIKRAGQPATRSSASKTRTSAPPRLSCSAAVMPAGPAPITATRMSDSDAPSGGSRRRQPFSARWPPNGNGTNTPRHQFFREASHERLGGIPSRQRPSRPLHRRRITPAHGPAPKVKYRARRPWPRNQPPICAKESLGNTPTIRAIRTADAGAADASEACAADRLTCQAAWNKKNRTIGRQRR